MSVTVFLDANEITAESFDVNVYRGRGLETEDFDAGGGVIIARNYSANFNPYFLVDASALLLESGDFLLLENGDKILLEFGNGTGAGTYGEILLGRKLTVLDGAVTVFTGVVEDYNLEYDKEGRCEASLYVKDALASIGAADMQEWNTEQELTGARVAAVLDDEWVGFPTGGAARDIATGTQPLAASTIDFDTNALAYLQLVNKSENGRMFVDRSGVFTFQDRYEAFGLTAAAAFSDDGTALPFSGIAVRFGTELLHFRVSVQREQPTIDDPTSETGERISTLPAPRTQTATNDALAALYPALGMRSETVGGVLFDSDHYSLGLAAFLLDRYTQLGAVVSGLAVPMHALDSSDRATVAALDVGDVVTLTWTPRGVSAPIPQTLVIESVEYVSDFTGLTEVTFQLSDARDPGYFVVSTDSVNGPQRLAP